MSAQHTPGPLEDAATVCERRDEFGHSHRGTASAVRAVDACVRRVLDEAIVGECTRIGYAWVPLEALAELRSAAIAKAEGRS